MRLKSDSRVYQSVNGSSGFQLQRISLQRDIGIGQGNVNPVLLLGLVDLGVFPAVEVAVWQSNLLTGDTGTADPRDGSIDQSKGILRVCDVPEDDGIGRRAHLR